jgi:hypothetical protein
MKKIDFGQAVQILTNMGVIVGIVLLGVELRQNNAALETQARLEREDVRRRALTRRIESPDLIRAWVKSAQGDALTPEEIFLVDLENSISFVDWMYTYMQVHDGLLDEEAIILGTWREQFHLPYRRMSESWAGTEHRYTPEFVEFMEEHIIGDVPSQPR